MYAVNLIAMAELTRDIKNLPLLSLLRGIVTEIEIQTLPGMGHASLLVDESVTDERWSAIVQLIRTHYRYPEFPLYEKTRGYWRACK